MLARQPGLPLEGILAAAGISRATFYRLFESRDALLRELKVPPRPSSRDRVLAAAMQAIGQSGLAALNMDELVAAADVSRANLYRLFPGKSALFRALLEEHSPLEAVASTIVAVGTQPPEVVMPALARSIGAALGARPGLARTLFYEITGGGAETTEAIEWALRRAIGGLLGYVSAEMESGRLRRGDPLLALQAFVGPIFFHLMTRPVAVARLGLDTSVDDAMASLAATWLRAMATPPSPGTRR